MKKKLPLKCKPKSTKPSVKVVPPLSSGMYHFILVGIVSARQTIYRTLEAVQKQTDCRNHEEISSLSHLLDGLTAVEQAVTEKAELIHRDLRLPHCSYRKIIGTPSC